MKVVLLHSEVNTASLDESDTLIQCESIEKVLIDKGHKVSRIPFCVSERLGIDEPANALLAAEPDVVFNLAEGVGGSSKYIFLAPLLLEKLGLPFTGCGSECMYTSTDKILSKRILLGSEIPSAPWAERRGTGLYFSSKFTAGEAYILKPRDEDASLGIDEHSVVRPSTEEELLSNLSARGPSFFAERFVEARELNLSLIADDKGGMTVLPAAEYDYTDFWNERDKVLTFKAKWDEESKEYSESLPKFFSKSGDEALHGQLGKLSEKCILPFRLKGYARVDFRINSQGEPFVLEVNANPGISPGAGFCLACEKAGIGYAEVVERILEDASR